MTYLLDDRIGRSAEHLELWEKILHPAYPRPASPEMAKAVSGHERERRLQDRRDGERRTA